MTHYNDFPSETPQLIILVSGVCSMRMQPWLKTYHILLVLMATHTMLHAMHENA